MDQPLPTDGGVPIQPQQPVGQFPQQPVTPVQQPVQPVQPIQPMQEPPSQPPSFVPQSMDPAPKKSGGSRFLMILGCGIVIIILAFAGFYFLIENQKNSETDTTQVTTTDTTSVEITSQITDVDETWNKYTNTEYGFSINVPKMIQHESGNCELVEGANPSYRYVSTEIPSMIIDDNDNSSIYITSEFFYRLTGEAKVGDITTYDGCEKVDNTLVELEDEDNWNQTKWVLTSYQAVDDDALSQIISDRYGEGCSLGGKEETSQEGVYTVGVAGDVPEDITNPTADECGINFGFQIYYNENTGQAIIWETGQSCSFFYIDSEDEFQCYDTVMVDSFMFTETNTLTE